MIDTKDFKRYILRYIDKNGQYVITGDCNECHMFPCKHIDTMAWKIKREKVEAP